MAQRPPALALPRKPRRDDLLEVTITGLDHDGSGTAWLDVTLGPGRQPRRFLVAVRRAVPGDRLRMTVERCRRGVIEGRVESLLEPSPERVTPRCPHFGDREQPGKGCGGCSLQSLGYQRQLTLKRELVAEALASAGIAAETVAPVIGMADPWCYRNKMELSFGDTRARSFAVGLHPLGYRYEVLDLQACYLMSSFVAPFAAAVRAWAEELELQPYDHRRDAGWLRTLTIREGKRTGERLVELTTSGLGTVPTSEGELSAAVIAERFAGRARAAAAELGESLTSLYWTEQLIKRGQRTRFVEHHLAGEATLAEVLEVPGAQPLRLQIHPRAFFQPNTLQAERLYGEVVAAAGGEGELSGAHVLDLYCGTGTIGLALAAAGAGRVSGIELSADAVRDARRNAVASGLEQATFIAGDVGKVLRQGDEGALGSVDLVVVDPPRCGLLPAALEQVLAIGPARLVYVSCNPRALGRDLLLLGEAGYSIRSIQPVDLFPHTAHVETVVSLTRDG